MLEFPPIQSWDAIHPLIIHFPIVLLLLAPFLIAAGALWRPESGRTMLHLALTIMVVGTLGTYLAVSSGEAAAQLAERGPRMEAVLDRHEQLAEATSIAFSVLTTIFAAILFIPILLKKTANRIASTALPLAFLVLYGGGVLLLTNTAHNGARLVHEFGITALMRSVPADKSAEQADHSKLRPAEDNQTDSDRR